MEHGGLKKLSTKEKLVFFAFLFVASIIIVLGFRNIGNAIKNPFAKSFAPLPPTAEEAEQQQKAELKTKDTDKDGLSDYDEIYIYNTSPYLADTDSDTASDKEELLNGTDPNCPKGQTCFGPGNAAIQESGAVKGAKVFGAPIQMPTAGQVLLQTLLGAVPDPKRLRAVLEQNGVSKQLLDSLDDAALMELAKKAAGGELIYSSSTSTTSGVPAQSFVPNAPQSASSGGVKQPTDAEQLRALLRSQGVSEEQLQKIDDAALLQAYQEVVQSNSQSSTQPTSSGKQP